MQKLDDCIVILGCSFDLDDLINHKSYSIKPLIIGKCNSYYHNYDYEILNNDFKNLSLIKKIEKKIMYFLFEQRVTKV